MLLKCHRSPGQMKQNYICGHANIELSWCISVIYVLCVTRFMFCINCIVCIVLMFDVLMIDVFCIDV